MLNEIEMERELINQILSVDKLEGVPLAWVQTRLAMIIAGEPPEKVFSRQQSVNQRVRTKVTRAELALKVNEFVLKGHTVLEAKERAAELSNTSYSSAELAWKTHGNFCRRGLPRESD